MSKSPEERWGKLAGRYLHNANAKRRLLALDGGGIRGVLTLEILLELERQLATATKKGAEFRLCDWFDYIGGTSTGAIIAAGLSLGMSVQELLTFYVNSGRDMFDKRALYDRWKSLYASDPLQHQLEKTFGAKTNLTPDFLRCLLLVVTRNATTDSPWPISSNPMAKYNDLERQDCNLRIPLWRLVRASTAAPIYFPPEVINWDSSNANKTFVFVDGGMTPYNNPAFVLFRMATVPAYNLGWKTGEEQMLLVSIGTGTQPSLGGEIASPERSIASNLLGIPGTLMNAAQVDQDINCRLIGRCVHGPIIDREVGDLIPRDSSGKVMPLSEKLGRSFLYARYDAELTEAGLEALKVIGVDPTEVAALDAVSNIDDLRRIGRAVGAEIDLKQFGPFVP